MTDLDDEFGILLDGIENSSKNYPDNEQDILRAWTTKLSEPAESENRKKIRNEYAETLFSIVSKREELEYPFVEYPQDEFLKPLRELIASANEPYGNKAASPSKEPSPVKSPTKGFSPGRSPSKGASPERRISPQKRGSISPEKEGLEKTGKEVGSREPSPTLGEKEKKSRELSSTLGEKGKESRKPSSILGEKGKESRKPTPTLGEKGKQSREPSPSHGETKDGKEKPKYNYVRLPCVKRFGERTGAIPKSKKPGPSTPEFFDTNKKNEFEDFDEMAKIIARSKGQSFAEFVVAISRHTADFGQELRAAMKTETSNFREYVDHVLSQRIKDLTEVLNEEQNTELEKIKRDIDKWQLELSHCKKRIKEMIPDFDLNLFKKDKNYLKKVFAIDFSSGLPQDESAKFWKDESRARLDWYWEMNNKMRRCNDRLLQELNEIKSKTLNLEAQESAKFQKYMKFLNSASFECQKMREERDRLSKENAVLLSEIQD